jgi:hypothetical protein
MNETLEQNARTRVMIGIANYDWSLHCGKCQAHRIACLYEWRNMIWANPYIGLTGIEKWDGWTPRAPRATRTGRPECLLL